MPVSISMIESGSIGADTPEVSQQINHVGEVLTAMDETNQAWSPACSHFDGYSPQCGRVEGTKLWTLGFLGILSGTQGLLEFSEKNSTLLCVHGILREEQHIVVRACMGR